MNEKIICEICKREWNSKKSIVLHIAQSHKIKIKDYYDKYFKKDNDGICLNCGKETRFFGVINGYRKFCSSGCVSKSQQTKEKKIQTSQKKYGTNHTFQSEEVKNKIKKTCLERCGETSNLKTENTKRKIRATYKRKYGFESHNQSENVKNKKKKTCFKNYGVEHPGQSEIIKKRAQKTYLKKYGVVNPFQSEEIKKKIKKTCKRRYGTEYALQSQQTKEKSKKTCMKKYGSDYWTQSQEGRLSLRKTANAHRAIQFNNGNIFLPAVGKKERLCINEIEKQIFINILTNQKRFEFFPDGLIEKGDLKIIIEYDESYHESEKQKKYDKKRDEYFMDNGYVVVRIKEKDWEKDKEIQIEKVKETIIFLEMAI